MSFTIFTPKLLPLNQRAMSTQSAATSSTSRASVANALHQDLHPLNNLPRAFVYPPSPLPPPPAPGQTKQTHLPAQPILQPFDPGPNYKPAATPTISFLQQVKQKLQPPPAPTLPLTRDQAQSFQLGSKSASLPPPRQQHPQPQRSRSPRQTMSPSTFTTPLHANIPQTPPNTKTITIADKLDGLFPKQFEIDKKNFHEVASILAKSRLAPQDLQHSLLLHFEPQEGEHLKPCNFALVLFKAFNTKQPPLTSRRNRLLFFGHATREENAVSILNEGKIRESIKDNPRSQAFCCQGNEVYSAEPNMWGEDFEELPGIARTVAKTTALAKHQTSFVIVGLAWGSLQKNCSGGIRTTLDLATFGGALDAQGDQGHVHDLASEFPGDVVRDHNNKCYCCHTKRHCILGIAFPVTFGRFLKWSNCTAL